MPNQSEKCICNQRNKRDKIEEEKYFCKLGLIKYSNQSNKRIDHKFYSYTPNFTNIQLEKYSSDSKPSWMKNALKLFFLHMNPYSKTLELYIFTKIKRFIVNMFPIPKPLIESGRQNIRCTDFPKIINDE